ncbi:hypothetical protein Taro_041679 [Colocasia esculenta]|uniref:Uncharacterized protein n=1 Tax=Colocasia esculenta TaxID=4460 RepID=A0A843WU96_COLES|nr:hypothetical protein [Colocasia esculenta]
MGGGAILGVPSEGSERSGRMRLPCMIRAHVAGCNCCCAAYVASVVARPSVVRVCAVVVVCLALCAVVRCARDSELNKCLAEVHRLVALCSGGSFPESFAVVLATVELLVWFEVCRLVGLRAGEVLPEQLLALLVELLGVVVLHYGVVLPGCASAGADVAYCALSSLWFLACGFRTMCSCSSVSVLCRLEPWCIVFYDVWKPMAESPVSSYGDTCSSQFLWLCVRLVSLLGHEEGWQACQYGLSCCHGAHKGRVLVEVRGPVALRLLTRRGGLSHSGCRGLKVLASYPFPLSPFFFPSPSPFGDLFLPSSPLCVFQMRRRVVRGAVALWTLRGARRRWPTDVKGPIGVRSS